ncbi:MAG: ABC transporter C-terminal domain-containing protein, partial [Candidatus Dormiibacterota bacterium]
RHPRAPSPKRPATENPQPSRREVELRIEALEQEKNVLELKLAEPQTFSSPDRGREVLIRFERVRAELEAAYATWLAREPSTER